MAGNNRTGYYQPYSDLVIKLHLRRLTGWMDSTDRQALQAEIARVLQAQIAQTELSIENWQRIGRITRFCDSVAFDFCFEQPTSGSGQPWPFSVETYRNYVVDYRLEDYPAVLDPMFVPFELSQMKEENSWLGSGEVGLTLGPTWTRAVQSLPV